LTKPKCSDAAFITLFEELGGIGTALELGCDDRAVYRRRKRLEKKLGKTINSPLQRSDRDLTHMQEAIKHPDRIHLEIENGHVIIGSDAHYWPHIKSCAHRGMVAFIKKYQPKVIIQNGDVFDGASLSRHPPAGVSAADLPSVEDEIHVCQDRLLEMQEAAPNAKRIFTLGNHDARFEMKLMSVAPEYAKVHGSALKDHFPYWEPCWSVWINDCIVVKHRFKGGVHAPWNNTIYAGKTIITGHLHSAKVVPFTDYDGTRWGCDSGTLADTFGPQFRSYMEDNPRNWRSAFLFLTFQNYELRWPELVPVLDENHVEFRGEVIEVDE